jgi:hypothetical protein
VCFHSISFKFVGGNAPKSDVFFVVWVYPEVVDSVLIVLILTCASGASSTSLSSFSLRVGGCRGRLLSHILRCFRTSEGFTNASRRGSRIACGEEPEVSRAFISRPSVGQSRRLSSTRAVEWPRVCLLSVRVQPTHQMR